jgi:type II secretory pathway component PulK
MIKHSGKERKGVALLTCIVLMALSSALLIAVVFQELSTRKKFEMINLETKAQNLALSAQEIAVGFLLEDAVAKIPTMISPIPEAKVTFNAEYTVKDKKPVRSALSGSFLIKTQDGKRVALSVGK